VRKTKPGIEMDRLWDKLSESIGDDIDSLQEFAGTTVLTRQNYEQLISEIAKALKVKIV